MFSAPEITDNPAPDRRHLRHCFGLVGSFVLLLWAIRIIESVSGVSFAGYGIYPRILDGLPGIVLAPWIHGSFAHLLANTPPLLVLGTALLYAYPRSARIVIPVVYLGTGFCVWLFAREAWHIGVSGLAFGFLLFVFSMGIIRWDRRSIALSMLVFFLYGSMTVGIIPADSNISFESHLAGACIGLLLAILLRNADPRVPAKKYSWEYEEELDVLEMTDESEPTSDSRD